MKEVLYSIDEAIYTIQAAMMEIRGFWEFEEWFDELGDVVINLSKLENQIAELLGEEPDHIRVIRQSRLSWADDARELFDALEAAQRRVLTARDELKGHKIVSDYFEILGDISFDMNSRLADIELDVADEERAEEEAMIREYYRMV